MIKACIFSLYFFKKILIFFIFKSPFPEFDIHEKSDKMKILFAEILRCCQIIHQIILTIVIILNLFLCIVFLIWCFKNILKVYQNTTNIPWPLKINQNCKFWYGNIPPANPAFTII